MFRRKARVGRHIQCLAGSLGSDSRPGVEELVRKEASAGATCLDFSWPVFEAPGPFEAELPEEAKEKEKEKGTARKEKKGKKKAKETEEKEEAGEGEEGEQEDGESEGGEETLEAKDEKHDRNKDRDKANSKESGKARSRSRSKDPQAKGRWRRAFKAEEARKTEIAEAEQDTPEPPKTPHRQVIIVGATPAGLTAALMLLQQGISVTIIDSKKTFCSSSRSSSWSSQSLELWCKARPKLLLEALLSSARPRRSQEVLLLPRAEGSHPTSTSHNPFGRHAPASSSSSSSGYAVPVLHAELPDRHGRRVAPHAVHLPQYVVENTLQEALRSLSQETRQSAEVKWQTTLQEVEVLQDKCQLKVSMQNEKGKPVLQDITCDYIIFCSPVGKGLVHDMPMVTPDSAAPSPSTKTVLSLDFKLLDEKPSKPAQQHHSSKEAKLLAAADRQLFLRVPEMLGNAEGGPSASPPSHSSSSLPWQALSLQLLPSGLLRLDALLPAGVDLARVVKDESAKDAIATLVGPEGPADHQQPEPLAVSAQRLRAGALYSAVHQSRVFLCGDALTASSPFGGSSAGNLAVEDAANLAWKLGLVLHNLAPLSLLDTYGTEREAAHEIACQREVHSEEVLAPSTPAHQEMQRAVLALLRGKHPMGAALLFGVAGYSSLPMTSSSSSNLQASDGDPASSSPSPFMPCMPEVPMSPLLTQEAPRTGRCRPNQPSSDAEYLGATFLNAAPKPGDPFHDSPVEDLLLEIEESRDNVGSLGPGFLLGHTGPLFTLVVFVLTVADIPWEALKGLEKSKSLQSCSSTPLTLEVLKRVVLILDASGLERMSNQHFEVARRAQRLGIEILADRGGASVSAYDARPGTTLLLRPDLLLAARWRSFRAEVVQEAFLRATGHLLHEKAHTRTKIPSLEAEAPEANLMGLSVPLLRRGCDGDVLGTLVAQMTDIPTGARLQVVTIALMLLANHLGSSEIMKQALGIASDFYLSLEQPANAGDKPLKVSGCFAEILEGEQNDALQLGNQQGNQAFDDDEDDEEELPWQPREVPYLPPSELFSEVIAKIVETEVGSLTLPPPPGGLPSLRAQISATLTEQEGLPQSADLAWILDGRDACLLRLLEELVTTPATSNEDALEVMQQHHQLPIGAEVLVLGPILESWRTTLQDFQVREFFPPPGAKGDFALLAEDVARSVSASTRVILMPIVSITTGLPPAPAEVERLGRWVDYECERRKSEFVRMGRMAAEAPSLVFMVDLTLRAIQMDRPGGSKVKGAVVWPKILTKCKNSILFGQIFHDWHPARAWHTHFVAVAEGELRSRIEQAMLLPGDERESHHFALVQAVATKLHGTIDQQVMESLRRRREVLVDAVTKAGLSVVGGRPVAGRFLLVRLPEDVDEAVFCAELAERNVVADEGWRLGAPGCIRLSFSEKFDVLEDSSKAYAEALWEVRRGSRKKLPKVKMTAAPKEYAALGSRSNQDEDGDANIDAAGDLQDEEQAALELLRQAEEALASDPEDEDEQLEGEDGAKDQEKVEKAAEEQGNVGDGNIDDNNEAEREEEAEEQAEEQEEAAAEAEPGSNEPGKEEAADQEALEEAAREGKAPPLGAQLRTGRKAVACMVQLTGSITTELISQAGFEVIIVDYENGAADFGVVASMVRSALGAGAHAMLRLAEAEEVAIRRALQCGVEGLLLPRVGGREEAVSLVKLVEEARNNAREDEDLEWKILEAKKKKAKTKSKRGDDDGPLGDDADGEELIDEDKESPDVHGGKEADEEGLDEWEGDEPPLGLDRTSHARPLVAVELDASCNLLEVAISLMDVEGLDLLLVDPEQMVLAGDMGTSSLTNYPSRVRMYTAQEAYPQSNQAGQAEVLSPPGVVDAHDLVNKSAGKNVDGPTVNSNMITSKLMTPNVLPLPPWHSRKGESETESRGGNNNNSANANLPTSPASQSPTAQSPTAPTDLNSILKAPFQSAARREAAGLSPVAPVAPSIAAAAVQAFWEAFDKLPSLASKHRKLLGSVSHARTSPFDLFLTGHSLVVLGADLVLLREGAQRHASEMKAERRHVHKQQQSQPPPQPECQFAAPLESTRTRLATNALVSQMRREKKALGAFLHLGDPLAAEMVGLAGFEVVVLDHEQGPGDLQNAVSLVHAAASAGAHTLLRVPGNSPSYLRRALQLGVEGIILPQTTSREQAKAFVSMARRAWGQSSTSLRGATGPGGGVFRPVAGSGTQHYRRRGEELLLKACQIESEAGLSAVKEIALVDGIDMIFFAPVELAAACPRGQEAGLMLALETAEMEVKQAKKLLGGMLVPGRSVQQMFSIGYDLVCTTSDVILIRSAAENLILETKPPSTGPQSEMVTWVESSRHSRLARERETLVAKLKATKKIRALGAMLRLGSPTAVELLAESGFDVLVVDHGRGAGDLLGAVSLIQAAARAGAHALLRVPSLDHSHLQRALQIGVEGIILPHVESASEAHGLVELCLYPSRTYRDDSHAAEARMKNQPFRRMDFSFAPPLVEFYGQRVAEFTRRQGESILIAVQIDTPAGANKARAIAKVPGVDMVFIDALRLSGLDVERIEEATRGAGKLLGGLLVPGCDAEDMFRAGYKLICAASDHTLLAQGSRICMKSLTKS